MKRILALTLALMLALSLTSALAEEQQTKTVQLVLNVEKVDGSPIYPEASDDFQRNVWDIGYSTTMLIWKMENTVSPQKSRTWNTRTHSYDEELLDSSINSVVEYPETSIFVTNNCNFALSYEVEFVGLAAVNTGLVSIGDSDSGTIPSAAELRIPLTLDVSKLADDMKEDDEGKSWSIGNLKITYTAGERVQPQSEGPDPDDPDIPDPDIPEPDEPDEPEEP